MRTNPVNTHHDSIPTSPAYPSSYTSSDDESYLLSDSRVESNSLDLFFIPRISFFQCEAGEFEQRKAELAARGFVCYDPVIQGTTYNVTYMRVEGLRSIALQILEAGEATRSDSEGDFNEQ